MSTRPWVLAAVVLAGCDGLINLPKLSGTSPGGVSLNPPGSTTNPPPPGEAAPRFSCTAPTAAGTTFPTLSRLTREELISTWSDLIGPTLASDPAVAASLNGLPSDALTTLSTLSDALPATWASALADASTRSATLILASAADRTRVLGACTTLTPLTDVCVQNVIATFGARAWRRDLDADEALDLFNFYTASGGGDAGLGYLVRRLLQAPPLAFHLEDHGSVEGDRVRLTPFEVANRIAYLTTGSMPDDALFAAARAGALSTSAQLRPHVQRLLDTPAGHARVRDLMRYYMQLGTLGSPYAPLAMLKGLDTTGLGDELHTEALDFAERVVFDVGDGSFAQLMTSPTTSPPSARVAQIFGVGCGAAPPMTFPWNDTSTFFHADGSNPGPAVQTVTADGWFVWQLPAARVPQSATSLRIDVVAASSDGAPLDLDINLNDNPLLVDSQVTAGSQTISATVTINAGDATKVGVYFKNAAVGRSLQLVSLTLQGTQSSSGCGVSSAPTHPGLLHRPALLLGTADRTSPILRGAAVRKRFLCANLGLPDPNAVAARTQQAGDLSALTNRERITQLTSAPQCISCHGQINPLGFTFEGFDQAGFPRTVEQRFDMNGAPTITQAIDTHIDTPNIDFSGVGPATLSDSHDLVAALAQSEEARACFTQRAFEYLRRSPLDPVKDGCALAPAEASAKQGTVRDVLTDLLSADDLLYRAP